MDTMKRFDGKTVAFYARGTNAQMLTEQIDELLDFANRHQVLVQKYLFFTEIAESNDYRGELLKLVDSDIDVVIIKSYHIFHIDYQFFLLIKRLFEKTGITIYEIDEVWKEDSLCRLKGRLYYYGAE